jgi:hypothetical protein
MSRVEKPYRAINWRRMIALLLNVAVWVLIIAFIGWMVGRRH